MQSFIRPGNGSTDNVVSKCKSYKFVGVAKNGTCGIQDFNLTAPLVECSDYVYDTSVFAHSITSDFNVAPCSSVSDDDWMPGAIFTKVQERRNAIHLDSPKLAAAYYVSHQLIIPS
jgi:hypothetical protein